MTLYSLIRSVEPYFVRRLSPEEIPAALELSWQVFLKFEASEYSQEGIAAFRTSLDDQERIRRRLFESMRLDYEVQVFTVNSSPYAVEVYRHLGFFPTDTEQVTNGIRYTPMRFEG